MKNWGLLLALILAIHSANSDLEAPIADATRGEVTLRDSILYINIARPFIAKQETVLRFPITIEKLKKTLTTLREVHNSLADFCGTIDQKGRRGIPETTFYYMFTMRESREGAAKYCEEHKMQLAEPQNPEELNQVLIELKKNRMEACYINFMFDPGIEKNAPVHTEVPISVAYKNYTGNWYPVVRHQHGHADMSKLLLKNFTPTVESFDHLENAEFVAHGRRGISVYAPLKSWTSLMYHEEQGGPDDQEKTEQLSTITRLSYTSAQKAHVPVVCEADRFKRSRRSTHFYTLGKMVPSSCEIELTKIESDIASNMRILDDLLESYNIMTVEQADYARGLSDLGTEPRRYKRENETDLVSPAKVDNQTFNPTLENSTRVDNDTWANATERNERALPFLLMGKGLLSVASFIYGEYKDYKFEKKLREHDVHLKQHDELLIAHSAELKDQAIRVDALELISAKMMHEQLRQASQISSLESGLADTGRAATALAKIRAYSVISETLVSQLREGLTLLSQTLQDLSSKKIPASIVPLVVKYFDTVQQPMPYALPHPEQSVFLDSVMVNDTFDVYVRVVSGNEIYDLFRYFPLPTFGRSHTYTRQMASKYLLVDSYQTTFTFLEDEQARECERGSCQHVGPFTPVAESTCDVGPLARVKPKKDCVWVRTKGKLPYFNPTKYGLLYSVPTNITARLACQVDQFNTPGSEAALLLDKQGLLEWAPGCDIIIAEPYVKVFGPPVVARSEYNPEQGRFDAKINAPDQDEGFAIIPVNVHDDIRTLSAAKAAMVVGLSVLGSALLAVMGFLWFKGYVLYQWYKKLKEGSQRIKTAIVNLYATVGDLHKFFSKPMVAFRYLQEGVKSYLVRPPKRPELNEKYFQALPEDKLSTALNIIQPSTLPNRNFDSGSQSRRLPDDDDDDEDSGVQTERTESNSHKKGNRKLKLRLPKPSPFDVVELAGAIP